VTVVANRWVGLWGDCVVVQLLRLAATQHNKVNHMHAEWVTTYLFTPGLLTLPINKPVPIICSLYPHTPPCCSLRIQPLCAQHPGKGPGQQASCTALPLWFMHQGSLC
jgi:hypothetical protein